jgi:hypothetical protein
MNSPRSLRSGVVPLGATLLIALLATTSADAQQERTRTRKTPGVSVISVVGKGTTAEPDAPPATTGRRGSGALDWSLIRAAVKDSSGKDVSASKPYLTLSASNPTDPKGHLSFSGKVVFAPGWLNLANAGTRLSVGFKPEAAGKSYIVDVFIEPQGGLSLTYQLPDGSSRDESSFAQSMPQHVLFLVQAANVDYQAIHFLIKTGAFNMVSATVTSVQ